MQICGKRLYDLLNKIGSVRVSGSEEEAKAAQILLDEIKAIGFEGHEETFEVTDAVQTTATLEVLEPYNKTYTVNKEMYAFSSYNPSINQYTFSLPVSTRGIYSNTFEDMNETDMRTDTTMEVICHKDDRKKISGIIVGMGGREIRFTD